MKTTLEISDALLARAKKLALRERTSVRALVEESLRRVLAERERSKRVEFSPVIFRGEGENQGLRPGMDSWEAMRDASYEGRGT